MNRKGFTLTELLAVIIVLGLLSTIAMVSYNNIRNNVMENEAKNTVSYIKNQALLFAKEKNKKEGTVLSILELIDNGYLELSQNDAKNILEQNNLTYNNQTNSFVEDLNNKCKIYVDYGANNADVNIQMYDYYTIFTCTNYETNAAGTPNLNMTYKLISSNCKDGSYSEYNNQSLNSVLAINKDCLFYIEDNNGNKYKYNGEDN